MSAFEKFREHAVYAEVLVEGTPTSDVMGNVMKPLPPTTADLLTAQVHAILALGYATMHAAVRP